MTLDTKKRLATNNIVRLMFMITIVWVLIIGESYLLFFVIRPIGPNIHENVVSEVLKIASTITLGGVWVATMFTLENVLFRRRAIGERP